MSRHRDGNSNGTDHTDLDPSRPDGRSIPLQELRSPTETGSHRSRNLTSSIPSAGPRSPSPRSGPASRLGTAANPDPVPWTPVRDSRASAAASGSGLTVPSTPPTRPEFDDPFVQRAPVSRVSSFDQNAWPLQSGTNLPELPTIQMTDDNDDPMSPPYGDRTPLTSSAQPMGTSDRGSFAGSASGPSGDGFLRPGSASRSGRSGSFSQHLSPITLGRAGTIVRKMSQRVVNLSNESEPEKTEKPVKSDSTDQAKSNRPESARVSGGMSDSERPQDAVPVKGESGFVPGEPTVPLGVNALAGRSLGFFSPQNRLRRTLCDILVHPFVEPFIFVLIIIQTVLLTAEAWQSVYERTRIDTTWPKTGFDFAILALFVIYTIEISARIIVSGLIINPVEYSTINRQIGLRRALAIKWHTLVAPYASDLRDKPVDVTDKPMDAHPGVLRSFTTGPSPTVGIGPKSTARNRLAHRAFLRHSFNRLDFVAVVAFWIDLFLRMSGAADARHIYLFRMLAALRIVRLLLITSGTTMIVRSLKKAAPLLVHVAFLISFFWLLFAVVGVQSFKASLRRRCVWIDPQGVEPPYVLENQYCGGHLLSNGTAVSWVLPDMTAGARGPKGYLCPPPSICVEGQNAHGGTVGFDNIFQSSKLVFVIMSSNTFSDLMYHLTDTDYLAAALFFATGLLILFFWLINLLVAVITTSFQVIRGESGGDNHVDTEHRDEVDEGASKGKWAKRMRIFFLAVITTDMIAHACRTADMGPGRARVITAVELATTGILDFEIVGRIIFNWRRRRRWWKSNRNRFDVFLAIITTIIVLPQIRIRHPIAYAWLSAFQIMRLYRVIITIPLARSLLTTVLGNTAGLVNLILFVFLLNFLGALLATQLFRHPGLIPQMDDNGAAIKSTFATIYNGFLTMYQVMSSEGWSDVLYVSTEYTYPYHSGWISTLFFILWFILSNFVVLNMFIAVIQEAFDVSEDEKRIHQVRAFLQERHAIGSGSGSGSGVGLFRRRPESGPTEALLKDAVVRDFLELHEGKPLSVTTTMTAPTPATPARPSFWSRWRSREPNPFYAPLDLGPTQDDDDDEDPTRLANRLRNANARRKQAQTAYLAAHPSYNTSLYIFGPKHPVRAFCQRLVSPSHNSGNRVDGHEPSGPLWIAFSFVVYTTVVAMVLLACIVTPVYQKEYFSVPRTSPSWFVLADMGFATLFSAEAIIKIVADGLIWTPNAYLRGIWGVLDSVVLVTLWLSVVASLTHTAHVSRAVGAFKAVRALRLLNLSDSARRTFHAIVIRGGAKLMSAALVSLALLIPFAIYGVNIFIGQFRACNDTGSGIVDLADCVGEFNSAPYRWSILAPRVAANPYYSFDNFNDALFILFQIVSQEGWSGIMWTSQTLGGVGIQPFPHARPGNAVFFVVFNLLGSVFVLTLFVSVFMRNYTEQTGVAFLTTEQRAWLELRKLLKQVHPSRRPVRGAASRWHHRCYRLAVRRRGRWQRTITTGLVIHLILLCSESYPGSGGWDIARMILFFILAVMFAANLVIRFVGLGWTRFRSSGWDLFALFAVAGTLVSLALDAALPTRRLVSLTNKLFLSTIPLLLIPRNDQLDQLFKTAAASLPAIANLVATWFVFFVGYAIALTQTLGLAKFGTLGSGNINFRTAPKALILLFRTSIGEGWNELMEDFATMTAPACTSVADSFVDGDCGSAQWARFLFISWSILSMYIFCNLLVSLVYESFSYVYQRSPSGISVLSRREIRRFKDAWAEFDPAGSGYISQAAFPQLLAELTGIFEMRIYPTEWSVGRLINDCAVDTCMDTTMDSLVGLARPAVDPEKLNARLESLPVHTIRANRARLNMFYEEILVSAHPYKGIAFSTFLLTLAHYKIIDDNKALRLAEFLHRRARLQRVEDAVRRNIVRSFLTTVFWRRRFKAWKREAMPKGSAEAAADLPAIVVTGQTPTMLHPDDAARPRASTVSSVRPSISTRPSVSTRSASPSASPAASINPFADLPISAWDRLPVDEAEEEAAAQSRPSSHSSSRAPSEPASRPTSRPPSRAARFLSGIGLTRSTSRPQSFHDVHGIPPTHSPADSPAARLPAAHLPATHTPGLLGPISITRPRASTTAGSTSGPNRYSIPTHSYDHGPSALNTRYDQYDDPGLLSGQADVGSTRPAGPDRVQDVLAVLDDSAWAGALRRSITRSRSAAGRSGAGPSPARNSRDDSGRAVRHSQNESG